MEYIHSLHNDPGYNIAVLSKEIEDCNRVVQEGLNITNALKADIAIMSREDYDINNKILLELSINNYNNAVRHLGLESSALINISKEDMNLVVYDDITAKSKNDGIKNDKKNLIKKIIEWIKNIITRMIVAYKKLQRNILLFINRLESRCDSLIKDINSEEGKLFYNREMEESISRIIGPYYAMNSGNFNTSLLRAYIEQTPLLDGSVHDIREVISSEPFNMEKLKDRLNYVPGKSLFGKDEGILYSSLTLLSSIFKGIDQSLLKNARPIISSGSSIKFIKIVSDNSDDIKTMLETRKVITVDSKRDFNYILNNNLIKYPSDRTEVKGYVNDLKELVKDNKLRKLFDVNEKKMNDVMNELKKASDRINPNMSGIFNNSLQLHSNFIALHANVIPIGYINLMDDMLKAYDVMISK